MRVLFALLVFLAPFLSSAQAAEAPPSLSLAATLLQLSGTAAVFDSAAVRQALADPSRLTGPDAAARRMRLLADAGLHAWHPPHVWVLRARPQQPGQWDSLAPVLAPGAAGRGFALVDAVPLPEAAAAIGLLSPDHDNPGLGGLLSAYGADALVLLREGRWALWAPGMAQGGSLPVDVTTLSDMLAEALAAPQQWPEAHGQPVVAVDNVHGLADVTAVEAALGELPGATSVRLIRVSPDRAWFALAAPTGAALAVALDLDTRFPPALPAYAALPPRVAQARQLACPFLVRRWTPEAAPAAVPAVPPVTQGTR